MSRMLFIQLILTVLVFTSAIGVVVSRHEARQVFIGYQVFVKERDALNLEWTQLQLEQATWATQARIEAAARERLGMIKPDPQRTVYMEFSPWAP